LDLSILPTADFNLAQVGSNRWTEAADADRIHFPLYVRTRRQGDRFSPLGLGEEIKLKDFLINERVPHSVRDDLPLLCDRRGIVWVAGMRLSDTVRLSEHTQRVLMMRMRRTR
jgi:tRNA(Ile)-lysidine synthase